MDYELKIRKLIKDIVGIDSELEIPTKQELGDYALPCFKLSKELKKSPQDIANYIAERFKLKNVNIKVIGPYVNFFIDSKHLFKEIIEGSYNSLEHKDNKNNRRIIIEYPSPNTNKSLHVGHVRNLILGNSISKILKAVGNEVIKVNLNNDRGIAITKLMLAYKLFGNNKTPKDESKKPDKFVEQFYVLFGKKAREKPELEQQALDMLKRWEENDAEIRALWKQLLSWVYEGYKQTYQTYKYSPNKEYYESDIYDKGREIILNAVNKQIKGFVKEGNAVYVDLEDKKLGKKYILRSDGTSVYITQDIYLAYLKEEDFNADKYIFVVASEQKYHFNVLFEILQRLGFGSSDKNYHFAFGMVYDKDGKPFSSRLGNTFGADEFYELAYGKAKEILDERYKNLPQEEIAIRASRIAYSAIVVSMLKVNPILDINFDIDKALSFEGETGPYLLYSYARLCSLLKKNMPGKNLNEIHQEISGASANYDFGENYRTLIKEIGRFREVVKESSTKMNPSLIVRYLIKLSQLSNEYYHNTKILNMAKEKKIRDLKLINAVRFTLKQGLELLDIDVLEEM